jgi:hypothetical protein
MSRFIRHQTHADEVRDRSGFFEESSELRDWKQKRTTNVLSGILGLMILTMCLMCMSQLFMFYLKGEKNLHEIFFNLPDALIAITTACLAHLVSLAKLGEQSPPGRHQNAPSSLDPKEGPTENSKSDEIKVIMK